MCKNQTKCFSTLPPAFVLPFPLDKRVELVRDLSQTLLELNYQNGKTHWQKTCRLMRANMKSQGIPSGEIQAQISKLSEAIQIEMNLISLGKKLG